MTEKFTCHEEIDAMTASHIVQVADAQSICEIPLEDINSFLEGLDEHIINGCIYWQDRLAEEDEGELHG